MSSPAASSAVVLAGRVRRRAARELRRAKREVLARTRPEPVVTSGNEALCLAPIPPRQPSSGPALNVVLLDDCRDQINFGARVLIDGLISIVQQSLPSAVITPIPSHWLVDVSGGWDAFLDSGLGMRQPSATYPLLADQFEVVADEWEAGRGGSGAVELIERMRGADLVLLNGEGSIYRTNDSAIRELFLAWFAKERLGVPTVFLNGMVHLTHVTPVLPGMVRKTFAALDGVAVREPWSLRNLQEFVPGIEAVLYPDSAFVITPDEARSTPAVEEVRARIGPGPYFCFDPGSMHMDGRFPRRSGLYDLIVRLQGLGLEAVLVNSSPADAYIQRIAEETGSIYVDTIVDYQEFMELVRDAQFVVSGRYHNPILAAIVGTPSITFASANHKVHGACEMLDGVAGTPFDGTYLRPDLDTIEARARECVQRRDELREQALEVCSRRRTEVAGLGDFAARVIRQR